MQKIMARPRAKSSTAKSKASFGFEAKRRLLADRARTNMGAVEYKHVVLGRSIHHLSPKSYAGFVLAAGLRESHSHVTATAEAG